MNVVRNLVLLAGFLALLGCCMMPPMPGESSERKPPQPQEKKTATPATPAP